MGDFLSAFLTKKAASIPQKELNFKDLVFEPGIIGMTWDATSNQIAKVTKGKPAQQAGVKTGWKIAEINGEVCTQDKFNKHVTLVRSTTQQRAIRFIVPPGSVADVVDTVDVMPVITAHDKLEVVCPIDNLESLNAYLATHSYLGNAACATLVDYEECHGIKGRDIHHEKFPHLARWHSHICKLMSHSATVDWRGAPVPIGIKPVLSVAGTPSMGARG